MRIQPLYDLQQEINRLFIAGSKFAKDDPRLLKVAATLEPLGQKAPVFKKLTDSIRDLAAADSQSSAGKLADLGTLLYSILYTQGEPLAEGVAKSPQVPLFDLAEVDTTRSYAELARVRELTTASSGRLEAAQEAFQDGVFADFRTYSVLDALLSDRYTELAEYVTGTVMPAAGKAIIPVLLKNFRYENTVPNVRRLRILRTLDAPQLPVMVEKIFAESLPDLQVEAIPYLGRTADNEAMLLQLAGDRNKKVRAAAYFGLAVLATPVAVEKLLEVFEDPKRTGKHFPAAEALGQVVTTDVKVAARAIAVVDQSYEKLAIFGTPKSALTDLLAKFGLAGEQSGKKATLQTAYNQLNECLGEFLVDLRVLRGKECAETYEYLARILTDERMTHFVRRYVDKAESGTQARYFAERVKSELAATMGEVFTSLDAEAVLDFYRKHIAVMTGEVWRPLWRAYFLKAAATWPEEQLLGSFEAAIRDGHVTGEDIFDVFSAGVRHNGRNAPLDESYGTIGPRWVELLYTLCQKHPDQRGSLHALRLLHGVEPADSERLNNLLASMPVGEESYQRDMFRIRLLAARKHPNRFGIVHRMLSENPNLSFAAFVEDLGDFWRDHPKEYLEKYRKLTEKLKNKTAFVTILGHLEGKDDA